MDWSKENGAVQSTTPFVFSSFKSVAYASIRSAGKSRLQALGH